MLDRRRAVGRILEDRKNLLVVAGLGASSWDVTAVGDNDLNFPLWGGMGGAITVGLGLAIAQPGRSVLVITGDGEVLMGLGSLATVAVVNPDNLSIVVLDNRQYGETGSQKSHTAFGVNLAAIAQSCGFSRVFQIGEDSQLGALRKEIHQRVGCLFGVVNITDFQGDLVLPPRDGAELKNRFRKKLLGGKVLTQK